LAPAPTCWRPVRVTLGLVLNVSGLVRRSLTLVCEDDHIAPDAECHRVTHLHASGYWRLRRRARSGCRGANFSGPGPHVHKPLRPNRPPPWSAGCHAPAQANLGSGHIHRPTSFPGSGPRLDNEPATGIFRSAPIALPTAGPRCAWAWATRRCFRWRPVPCPTCWPGRPPG